MGKYWPEQVHRFAEIVRDERATEMSKRAARELRRGIMFSEEELRTITGGDDHLASEFRAMVANPVAFENSRHANVGNW